MTKKEIKLENAFYMLHPRPAVLISALWKKPNVMTCAWTTPICDDPAVICIVLGDQSWTARMIKRSKEFVVNIPPAEILPKVLKCGRISGKNKDKAKLAGLTYSKAKKVDAPIIEECVGHLECKVIKALKFDGCNVFIAKVVAAYASGFDKCWKKPIPEHLYGDVFSFGNY